MTSIIAEHCGWEIILNGKDDEMKNIKAEFLSCYERKPCPYIDKTIEETWAEKVQHNNRLYNASKFRLHGVTTDNDGHTVLQVGLTDYKDTICTNHFQPVTELYEYGINYYANQQACFGDATGVACVLLTCDNFIVLIKRSGWVAESKNMFDTPGGHSEPEEMLKKLSIDPSKIYNVSSEDVIYEIFHSMVREVRDEINIAECELLWPTLLGVARNKTLGGKPVIMFVIQSKLNKAKIKQLYEEGGAESDESTQIHFLSLQDIKSSSQEQFVSMVTNMAPCGQATMYLFHQYLQNE